MKCSALIAIGLTALEASAKRTRQHKPGREVGVWYKETLPFFPKFVNGETNSGVVCIDFNAGSETFYYTLQPPWGSGAGSGTGSGSICFPAGTTGGAMYLGSTANPGPGSTKLECDFPETSSGTATCDMSLVDGYSIPVQCSYSGASTSIGGTDNLYDNGISCPDVSGPNCINSGGYASAESGVNAFFQQGIQNGQNYWIWDNSYQGMMFAATNNYYCNIGDFS